MSQVVAEENVPAQATDGATESKDTELRHATEKGRQYQLDLLSKRQLSIRKRLYRQIELSRRSIESNNYDLVQQESANLDKVHSEIQDNNAQLTDLLPEEEQEAQFSFVE